MKTNQAKAVAGIKYRVTTRDEHARAERDCVAQIIVARRAGNDVRAAELSEAKTFFQKRARARNACATCDETIARGATHCRIHSRPQSKMIVAPDGFNPPEGRKGEGNGNASGNKGNTRPILTGDPCATLGYYAAPIQKIIAKWRGIISEDLLKRYFSDVALPVVRRDIRLKLRLAISPDHWQAVFELGAEIAKFHANKRNPRAWLLGGEAATNGRLDSWNQVRAQIIKQGGPAFTKSALAKASHDLKLSASP